MNELCSILPLIISFDAPQERIDKVLARLLGVSRTEVERWISKNFLYSVSDRELDQFCDLQWYSLSYNEVSFSYKALVTEALITQAQNSTQQPRDKLQKLEENPIQVIDKQRLFPLKHVSKSLKIYKDLHLLLVIESSLENEQYSSWQMRKEVLQENKKDKRNKKDKNSYENNNSQKMTGMLSNSYENAISLEKKEPLTIIYEDSEVVVVNKPWYMATHPAKGWRGETVVGSLKKENIPLWNYGNPSTPGVVSRLDVGTSGVCILAKTHMAYDSLRKQFTNHSVEKIYMALVEGNLQPEHGRITAPIARRNAGASKFDISPLGKPAITNYDVESRFGTQVCLVRINLETGRTHQIRVHFSSIGHPLVGDMLYGANRHLAKGLQMSHQWLHAQKLEYEHPLTHQKMIACAPYPYDLQKCLEKLKQNDIS